MLRYNSIAPISVGDFEFCGHVRGRVNPENVPLYHCGTKTRSHSLRRRGHHGLTIFVNIVRNPMLGLQLRGPAMRVDAGGD